ncbi:MAG: tRNA preQ1(34) S-adenosylmethionine ribosyltransferase-isomerase QueA [Deltaproteobacteria bacterium]|nr:tRNA preQ1(34) S-adenosylmethionine ribosyltransferase-isomerase QueA [Deltaproteobacteria bacterium]MBW2447154.1 tRNA preQ1(34) S-adenosylmethionine ribosyltransferase-isomerase QueA [Deltaproteobacteria bacterium]
MPPGRDDLSPAAAAELAGYDFELPAEQVAQHPPAERDGARMMVMARGAGEPVHARVVDLPQSLREGDLLVVNTTRVVPARLRGRKASGGAAEALLLGPDDATAGTWRALVRHGGRQRVGVKLRFGVEPDALDAEVVALLGDGEVRLAFASAADPYSVGEPPLPPYIQRDAPDPADVERYQTVFAREPGAVAAPTAGLHLSPSVLTALEARGVERAEVVLHVGAGTFRPVSERDLEAGQLHAERYELPEATARAIERTRTRGGRVFAVGTTTTRVLETCATEGGNVAGGGGETRLFLRPGARFRVVDGLLTNFHLPRSSLVMLVAAFCGANGRERVLAAYAEAVAQGYRFFSYGDAMLIRPD